MGSGLRRSEGQLMEDEVLRVGRPGRRPGGRFLDVEKRNVQVRKEGENSRE